MSSEDERTIRRYLLHDLTEPERQEVEERMMTDSEFFEEVTFAEDELVAEYARDGLKGAERRKFQKFFLTTPQGRQDLDFNRAFARHLPKTTVEVKDADQSHPLASWLISLWRAQTTSTAFALGAVIILAVLNSALFVTDRRHRTEIERLQAQVGQLERELTDEHSQASQLQQDLRNAQERNTAQEAQLADLKNAVPRTGPSQSLASGILSVILSPGIARGTGSTQVRIPPETHEVEFRLRVASPDYGRYNAEVMMTNGRSIAHPVLATRRVRSETQAVLRLPAAKLATGDYEIKLFGTTAGGDKEVIDSYYFTVAIQ